MTQRETKAPIRMKPARAFLGFSIPVLHMYCAKRLRQKVEEIFGEMKTIEGCEEPVLRHGTHAVCQLPSRRNG
jgi:hypothetical protein